MPTRHTQRDDNGVDMKDGVYCDLSYRTLRLGLVAVLLLLPFSGAVLLSLLLLEAIEKMVEAMV